MLGGRVFLAYRQGDQTIPGRGSVLEGRSILRETCEDHSVVGDSMDACRKPGFDAIMEAITARQWLRNRWGEFGGEGDSWCSVL
jgi:hypothetical protein